MGQQHRNVVDEAAEAFLSSPPHNVGIATAAKHWRNRLTNDMTIAVVDKNEDDWDVAEELRAAASARRARGRQQRESCAGIYKGRAQTRLDDDISLHVNDMTADDWKRESTNKNTTETVRFSRAFICAELTGHCNLSVRVEALLSSVVCFQVPHGWYNSIDIDPLVFDAPAAIADRICVRTPIRDRRSSSSLTPDINNKRAEGRPHEQTADIDDIDIMSDLSSAQSPHNNNHTPNQKQQQQPEMATSPFLLERAARGSIDFHHQQQNHPPSAPSCPTAAYDRLDDCVNDIRITANEQQNNEDEDESISLWGGARHSGDDLMSLKTKNNNRSLLNNNEHRDSDGGSSGCGMSLYSIATPQQQSPQTDRHIGICEAVDDGVRVSAASNNYNNVIKDQSARLLRRLRKEVETIGSEELSFNSLMTGHTKETVVRAFMDVLHLATRQQISVHQAEPFGDISITPGTRFLESRCTSPVSTAPSISCSLGA
eukprot:GHVS01025504.1.p1 GENE.GHVS01025504.1~~GHVS01025504.1.p1  ORF type:complete len:556 (+),score=112.82 GHVS01025504.1:216-1670(+)